MSDSNQIKTQRFNTSQTGSKQFELLAPGGDLDSILAAIAAGADAVYCGLDRFNARNRATNLNLESLLAVVELAHQHQCQIFLTLNIMLLESEVPAMLRLLSKLVETDIDGVIVQDLGLAYLLKHHFPSLDVHASTQMNTHNSGQIKALSQLGASRVNLSRELDLAEITELASYGQKHNVLMEVFVHGSYCIGFSGLCYISSTRNGASGNRGRCSQPCREQFQTTETGHDYPMNMKDNSAFHHMQNLADAGVYSLKIEGRIKKSHYVYTTVSQWREQIDAYVSKQPLKQDMTSLYTVFNRDFSDGYLASNVGEQMYIDNPRNFAPQYRLNQQQNYDLQQAKQAVYDDNTAIMKTMHTQVEPLKQQLVDVTKPATNLKAAGESVELPVIDQDERAKKPRPRLSVLVSDLAQYHQLKSRNADVYIQLPNALRYDWQQWLERLNQYPQLLPSFPAVLIGEDYKCAIELLKQMTPRVIMTHNLGIGLIAQQHGLEWIAGSQLNTSNSYALECLKREFGASGAYLSNELNAKQLKRVKRPAAMRVFHTIFQPNTIMTSRQCLFMPSSGCRKTKQNKGCLRRCEKRTSIINLNDSPYVINKRVGEYNQLFSQYHTLITDSLAQLDHLVTDVMVDFRDIVTETRSNLSISEQLDGFVEAVEGRQAPKYLLNMYSKTSHKQFAKGV